MLLQIFPTYKYVYMCLYTSNVGTLQIILTRVSFNKRKKTYLLQERGLNFQALCSHNKLHASLILAFYKVEICLAVTVLLKPGS